MSNKRILYDFCPRCSGLMKDGICLACGYDKRAGEQSCGQKNRRTSPAAGRLSEGPKKSAGPVIGICIGGLIFVLLFCVAIYLIGNGLREKVSAGKTDAGAKVSGETASGYVPDPSDEYYVEVTNALRNDLTYQISWKNYQEEQEEGTDYFGVLYPQVVGDFPNRDSVNEALKERALDSLTLYRYLLEDENADSCAVYVNAYVTLMDEEILSVAYRESIYINGVYLPEIRDLNVNVRTGEVLEHEEMVSYTPELAGRVCSQNERQNSTSLEEIGLTEEEVLGYLQGGQGVAFYTPVGLELGFNYAAEDSSYGWLTVTIKDYEKYKQ